MNEILSAAILQAAEEGDTAAVAKLKALADQPGQLAALVKRLQGVPARESSRLSEEHGPPPFPGAVLMGDPPRWHNPHADQPVGENPHADRAAKFVSASPDLPPELQKEYTQHLAAVLAKMPEASRKAIDEALDYDVGGAKVVFHPDTAGVKKAMQSAGVKCSKDEEVGGGVVFNPRSFDGVQLHLDGAGAGNSAQGVYAHELGHLVALGVAQRLPKNGGGAEASADPAWKKAWASEIKSGTGEKKLSTYARVNEHEGFAELYRHLHERGADDARKRWPKCVKFLESKGLLK